MDVARGRSAISLGGLWAQGPAWCGLLRSFGQQRPTLRAGMLCNQITKGRVFCKQINDDNERYGTKRRLFQDYVTLFGLEETFSDLKWAMVDLQLALKSESGVRCIYLGTRFAFSELRWTL